MYSAFGVDHGDLVSKGGMGLIPKALGGGGVRMGSPKQAYHGLTTGFSRARKAGSSRMASVGRGIEGAFKSSPGTMAALGTGTAVTGGVGAGFALNRNS